MRRRKPQRRIWRKSRVWTRIKRLRELWQAERDEITSETRARFMERVRKMKGRQ